MATPEVIEEKEKVQGINADYEEKFGFHDPETGYAYKAPKGLTREIVEQISEYKDEPDWMREFRLKSLDYFESRPTPQWGGDLDQIDFDDIHYFVRASERPERDWDDVPEDNALYNYYKHGELKAEGSSITEGIGQGRITANLEGAIVDDAFQIPDAEAIPIAFDLLQHEGLCMGGSTGVNVAGAIRMAQQMGPGHTIVTILCDYGTRYASKLFNPAFLREKNLPVPAWLEKTPDVPNVTEEVPA